MFDYFDFNINMFDLRIPETIGVAIPMKATFFITYIMVDGWSGTAGEILRLEPLIIYHLKNFFLVKTEKDREEAMDPGSINFNTGEPQVQFYFLIGLIYSVVTPLLINPVYSGFFRPCIFVYRHQVKSQMELFMKCLSSSDYKRV
ncbi:putative calcium-dependent channel, 7TM region phosphate [Helianthus anomalus]